MCCSLRSLGLYTGNRKTTNVKTISKADTFIKDIISKEFITEKQLTYFRFDFKNSFNLGKMYFFPKILKQLSNVSERLVISNYGTPAKKVSENRFDL